MVRKRFTLSPFRQKYTVFKMVRKRLAYSAKYTMFNILRKMFICSAKYSIQMVRKRFVPPFGKIDNI